MIHIHAYYIYVFLDLCIHQNLFSPLKLSGMVSEKLLTHTSYIHVLEYR